ncbi:DUF2147 domain-containing protein [Frigidibacter albus]|uniref:DUF2147 domain-containing protein n=1 Tax=Frigidibacter albus TaxID=1465486 RepID=A0A6L8VJ93_9RHOB|nr:DUF2147 domain-containing protein [Frigidibacter albus]MZQ89776.1 DUF2147 domain-containing protein [Frigidibacter albus]NBE31849.1 DUF2147 domain-containing protein [Frigidibacter albus]GGH56720.1 hypothetical protein GCM10011341_25480 [Frigidibacter albus]
MRILAIAAAFALGATAALADPVEGVWQTEVDDGAYAHVAIAPCGAKLCGTIARTFNAGGEYASPNVGKPIVWDMVAKGDGAYGDGKIWQPSTDKVYRSKMALSGNTLKVSGCVGPICKGQTWSRAN